MTNKFNDIFLKAKTISEKQQKGYRVYTDKDNFALVEANTVAEAIEKSGNKSPYKIEPLGIVTKSIFMKSELAEKQSGAQPAEQPAPQN